MGTYYQYVNYTRGELVDLGVVMDAVCGEGVRGDKAAVRCGGVLAYLMFSTGGWAQRHIEYRGRWGLPDEDDEDYEDDEGGADRGRIAGAAQAVVVAVDSGDDSRDPEWVDITAPLIAEMRREGAWHDIAREREVGAEDVAEIEVVRRALKRIRDYRPSIPTDEWSEAAAFDEVQRIALEALDRGARTERIQAERSTRATVRRRVRALRRNKRYFCAEDWRGPGAGIWVRFLGGDERCEGIVRVKVIEVIGDRRIAHAVGSEFELHVNNLQVTPGEPLDERTNDPGSPTAPTAPEGTAEEIRHEGARRDVARERESDPEVEHQTTDDMNSAARWRTVAALEAGEPGEAHWDRARRVEALAERCCDRMCGAGAFRHLSGDECDRWRDLAGFLQEPAPSTTRVVRVSAAAESPPPEATIVVAGGFPRAGGGDRDWARRHAERFDADAGALVDVLAATLPGGTLDRLTSLLLARKASQLVVRSPAPVAPGPGAPGEEARPDRGPGEFGDEETEP